MTPSERRQVERAAEDAALVAWHTLRKEAPLDPQEGAYMRIPRALHGNKAAVALFERRYRGRIEDERIRAETHGGVVFDDDADALPKNDDSALGWLLIGVGAAVAVGIGIAMHESQKNAPAPTRTPPAPTPAPRPVPMPPKPAPAPRPAPPPATKPVAKGPSPAPLPSTQAAKAPAPAPTPTGPEPLPIPSAAPAAPSRTRGAYVSAPWPNDGTYYNGSIIDLRNNDEQALIAWADGGAPSWVPSYAIQAPR